MKKIIFIFILFFASLNAQEKLIGIPMEELEIYKIIKVPPKPSEVGGVLLMGLLTGFLNFMGGPPMRDSLVYIGNLESKDSVIAVLGQPLKRRKYIGELDDVPYEDLKYDGLTLVFADDLPNCSGFELSSKDYAVGKSWKISVGKTVDPILFSKYNYRTYDNNTHLAWTLTGDGMLLDWFMSMDLYGNYIQEIFWRSN